MKYSKYLSSAILALSLWAFPIAAQLVRVNVAKRDTPIPKACESVAPAKLEGAIDLQALRKEAICKGAGDMLSEYTYVMQSSSREKDKKGNIREDTTTYEVFIPTLKSGMHTTGILLVTNRNGVAVPPDELDKERLKTGERLEKEEADLARRDPAGPKINSRQIRGMPPIGMYTSTAVNRVVSGLRLGGVSLAVDDFLRTCQLKLVRREQDNGRETLVFGFIPFPNAPLSKDERYMAQLTGEIRIDVQDRIVTRLSGWPASAPDPMTVQPVPNTEKPPAVFVEMMRLHDGIWLPHVIRINGLDYPATLSPINSDTSWIYSDYLHFSTEIKDVKVNSTSNP